MRGISQVIDNPSITICDKEGFCVGKLSQAAIAKWIEKMAPVQEVRVIAMVERESSDE
jgi:hypothetical protein